MQRQHDSVDEEASEIVTRVAVGTKITVMLPSC